MGKLRFQLSRIQTTHVLSFGGSGISNLDFDIHIHTFDSHISFICHYPCYTQIGIVVDPTRAMNILLTQFEQICTIIRENMGG